MEELSSKKFFKITNEEENHNGYQYYDGLNILKEPFREIGHCVPGGFYFTDIDNILEFLNYGIYLRVIKLPSFNDPEFKIVEDKNKWRVNKIILAEKYELSDPKTFEYLISLGADIRTDNNIAIRWASENGYLKVVKYLISMGADIRAGNDSAVRWNSAYGYLEMVKYLVSLGADITAINNFAVRYASANGHLEVVKYLVSLGANIKADKNYAIIWASANGHLEVVKYLISLGADIRAENDCIIDLVSANGHLEIIKYLVVLYQFWKN